jgi:hypothetical protein
MRAVIVALAVIATAGIAHAQPTDVPALIKLIENQPADMDRSVWKEKRRDAAKKLVQSKDKRAVPVLIKLADGETFDIIGEVAIEGLGALGDRSAVPTLQKIVNDPARDKGQRELARKALAKLGATAQVEPTPPTPPPPATPDKTPGDTLVEPPPDKPSTHLTDTDVHPKPAVETAAMPDLPADVLAAYERVTIVGGTADLGYDTIRKRASFDADLAGSYQKRVERPQLAYGYDASAHVVAGYINPDGRAQSRGAEVDITADGEARFYSGSFYAVGKVIGSTQMSYEADLSDDPTNNPDVKDTSLLGDFQIAVGPGYGRLLDVGAAIRVRRLSRALADAHALGKPIDAATAKTLELTWWSLRAERSAYPQLVATVKALREAGILLGEPDAGLTYEILNVLRDTQLFARPQGFDAQILFSEGYLKRPDDPMIENGRVEQLLANVGYGQQLDDDTLEIAGSAYARLRVLAPDGAPAPWAVGATASMRKFTYGEHGDPFGMLDLTGGIGVSDDDLMGSKAQQQITGQLGFTFWLNQASGLRLAATATENAGELFIGATLQATYGFLDGTFAGL